MLSRLTQIVERARGCRVLLIGDLILDRYIFGDAERISPEAPVPVLHAVDESEGVGGSANVAACLNALGLATSVCGVVGDDRHGRRLLELLGEFDTDLDGVLATATRPTTSKTRMVGLAQHRHRQQLLRLDREVAGPLPAAEAARIKAAALAAIPRADAVCIEDYEKGVVTADLVGAVVAEAKRLGKPVLVDPGRLSDYSRYRGASILTPNRNELALAVGASYTAHPDIAKAAEELRDSLDAEAVVVTLDREGALIVARGAEYIHVPTRPRSVYDNTGAGDAVLAMLAAALAGGADLADAVRLANIAGGLEVERFGCVPIPADDVLAELRLEDRRRSGKLRSLDELLAELKVRRDRGETVVFTNGCYDILHVGHVDLLEKARLEGSLLVVAINSDDSVRRQNKGEDRPLNTAADRARVLGSLSCVDYVVVFDETTPAEIIQKIRPDVLIKGADWANRGVVGQEFVESCGGRVALIPLVEGYSTTSLVERIRGEHAETPKQ